MPTKNNLSVGTLTSVFKDSLSLRIHKIVKIVVYFFACQIQWKDLDPEIMTDPDPNGPKHTGPKDPDP